MKDEKEEKELTREGTDQRGNVAETPSNLLV